MPADAPYCIVPLRAPIASILPLLLAAAVSAARGEPARTEEELSAVLAAAESRYEETGGRLASALGRRATGAPGAEADLVKARSDLLAVFADAKLVETLQQWRYKRTMTRDRTLARRVDIWSQASPAAAVELDPAIASMADRLGASLARYRYVLDGRESDPDALRAILADSDDEAQRRRAWLALMAPGKSIAPDLKRLNRMRAVKARDLGAPTYFDLIYAANEIDNRWLKLMLHTVQRRTRAATTDLDSRLRRALGKQTLAPWDFDRGLAILARQRGVDVIEQRVFPGAGGPAALERLARMMGLAPEAVAQRRARAPIPGDFEQVIERIPGDLMLLTRREPSSPAPGSAGYTLFFGAGAGALQASATKTASPMLKGYDWVPGTRNAIFARAREEILAGLLNEPVFLRALGMSGEEIPRFLEQQRDRALMRLRWIGVNMSMEHVMFLNPDADLDARYRESFANFTGWRLDPADPLPWTAEPRFVARPVSWFADLTALSVSADVLGLMREQAGAAGLPSEKAGPWLVESCFAPGETVPLQERISSGLKAGFDFKRYLESLGIAQPAK